MFTVRGGLNVSGDGGETVRLGGDLVTGDAFDLSLVGERTVSGSGESDVGLVLGLRLVW